MSRHFFIRFRGAPLLTAVSLLICLPSATQAVPPGVPEPIGEWLFNGDFLDSSGNGNHGTPIGDPEFVETPRGIGIALDGVDDEVDFGNGCVDGDCLFEFSTDELFPRQLIDVSLEAWISIDPDPTENGNHDTNTANRIHNIFGKTGEEYMLTYESAQPETPDLHRVGVAFFASTPALEDPCFGGPGCNLGRPAVELGTFVHVVATKSSRTGVAQQAAAIYHNGTLGRQGGGHDRLCPNPERHLIIGRGGQHEDGGNNQNCADRGDRFLDNWLKAVYEEVRIYDSYLTEEQIRILFEAGPTHIIRTPDVLRTGIDDTVATEFLSEAGTTYELEYTTDHVNWAGTGAVVVGDGTTMRLFDPLGYSDAKGYRVAIR